MPAARPDLRHFEALGRFFNQALMYVSSCAQRLSHPGYIDLLTRLYVCCHVGWTLTLFIPFVCKAAPPLPCASVLAMQPCKNCCKTRAGSQAQELPGPTARGPELGHCYVSRAASVPGGSVDQTFKKKSVGRKEMLSGLKAYTRSRPTNLEAYGPYGGA